MTLVRLVNKHPFLFLYREKGGGKQGAEKGRRDHTKQGPQRGQKQLTQAESVLCFFLLNDLHAEANWSEMCKLFSAFHELPNKLVIFVFVFLFHFCFLGNMIAVFPFQVEDSPPHLNAPERRGYHIRETLAILNVTHIP